MVTSSLLAGTVVITFFVPASRCAHLVGVSEDPGRLDYHATTELTALGAITKPKSHRSII
jgi:hypothetical protein